MVLFTEIRAIVLQSVQMYKKILSFHPAFYVFICFHCEECAENAPMPSRERWTLHIIERQRFRVVERSVQYFPAYVCPVSVPSRPPSLTG